MRVWKLCCALLLAAATAFYAMTAVVYGEAGAGADLVLKPRPQWMLATGDKAGDHLLLIDGHHDGVEQPWVTAYGAGYFLTSVGWIAALCLLVVWAFRIPPIERRRRTEHSPARPRE